MESFKNLLISLGLSTEESIEVFHPRVRDNEGIRVLRCKRSQVLFLENNGLGSEKNYKEKDGFSYWSGEGNKQERDQKSSPQIYADDIRRKDQFLNQIKGKKWLDFGCGSGGVLRLCSEDAEEAMGLELQPDPRNYLNEIGIKCVEHLGEIEDESLDVITMFHVFEHLQYPIETLVELKAKLVQGGRIIIEVPQANDILISLFNLESFKDFTFWSEHLILHNKKSLSRFIEASGLGLTSISGYQRYPLSNHLYWLVKSLPGGHEKWSFLNNPLLEKAYSRILQSIDRTDTLIALGYKK